MAVNLESEVILGEVLDKGAFLVADDHREVHEAGIDGDRGGAGGWLCRRGVLGGERNCERKRQS